MIVITGYTVLGRLVLKSSPAWGEELVLMCIDYALARLEIPEE